ncbi:MAG: type II toxin-antitoxin system RelE/ParE family toxin [Candidatus ainarchaeum sp.]|nr:type II toxin-antitoxin system RelE/ParE family toxin [Candidatus ainarchaeum sp.]
MSYELVFDKNAISFISKLPKDARKRIYEKLALAKDDPHHFFERLSGRSDYKLRVGDYRVIADLNDSLKRIEVTLIGHRKNVYEK